MKTEWYDRTIQALQLNGKGERTQQAYARSVRMLTQFYGKAPDLITEQELQDYFLHRKNVDHWSPNTMSRLGGTIAEFASSTNTSSNETGTFSEFSEPKMSDDSRPFLALKKSDPFLPRSKPSRITPIFPPSIPAA